MEVEWATGDTSYTVMTTRATAVLTIAAIIHCVGLSLCLLAHIKRSMNLITGELRYSQRCCKS